MSPHSSTRIYFGSQYLYRTDDRGDHWTRISPDLSRNLRRDTLPIMGKVWPAGSVALNASTTSLSNIVAIDESPLLEGTHLRRHRRRPAAGHRRRRQELAAHRGFPRRAEVHLRQPTSLRRRATRTPSSSRSTTGSAATTSRTSSRAPIAAAPGRTSPATCRRSTTSGRWRRITSTANLIFAGTEFGLFVTVDGGQHWTQLKGGLPGRAGARHHDPEARERSRGGDVRPRLLRARRLQRAARDHAADARRGRAALPAAPRVLVHARAASRPPARPVSARCPETGRRPIRRSAPGSPTT